MSKYCVQRSNENTNLKSSNNFGMNPFTLHFFNKPCEQSYQKHRMVIELRPALTTIVISAI